MERTDRVRFFRAGGTIHSVPAGRLPHEVGVDPRAALEVPEPPRGRGWAWAGPSRGWVKTARGRAEEAKRELEERRDRRAWHDDVDSRLAAIEAALARILATQGPGGS